MTGLLKELYSRYNNFSFNLGPQLSLDTVLRIYTNGADSIEDLEQKLTDYEKENFQRKISKLKEQSELVTALDTVQPSSCILQLLYIDLLLDSMEDDYFSFIHLERIELYRIIISLTLYLLFLQTYTFSNLYVSKSASKEIFGRRDFYVGITELKKVCGSITSQGYTRFCELFALDINEHSLEKLQEVGLFKDGDCLFIFYIYDFLEYMRRAVENKYRAWSKNDTYSRNKGKNFEDLAYGLTSLFYNNSVQNVFYYEPNQNFELDLVIQEGKYIIVTECKSGTIDLRGVKSDYEVTIKLHNKLKKAYKTLDSVAKHIDSNETFKFLTENKTVACSGTASDFDFIYLHLTMYPIDALSSSIHTLDDNYYSTTGLPKLTISFEHFLAICVDCYTKNTSLGDYLSKRIQHMIRYPGMKFDNNELDLYHTLTNKSVLRDAMDSGLFEQLSPNAKMFSTFSNFDGSESVRPAFSLIRQLDSLLLILLVDSGKDSYGLNKKYLNYMKQYLREPH